MVKSIHEIPFDVDLCEEVAQTIASYHLLSRKTANTAAVRRTLKILRERRDRCMGNGHTAEWLAKRKHPLIYLKSRKCIWSSGGYRGSGSGASIFTEEVISVNVFWLPDIRIEWMLRSWAGTQYPHSHFKGGELCFGSCFLEVSVHGSWLHCRLRWHKGMPEERCSPQATHKAERSKEDQSPPPNSKSSVTPYNSVTFQMSPMRFDGENYI